MSNPSISCNPCVEQQQPPQVATSTTSGSDNNNPIVLNNAACDKFHQGGVENFSIVIELLTQALVVTREQLSTIMVDAQQQQPQQQQQQQQEIESVSFIDDSMKLQQQIQSYCRRSNRSTSNTSVAGITSTSTYDMMDTDEQVDDLENLMETTDDCVDDSCHRKLYAQPIRLGQFGSSSAITTTVASLESHLACILFNLGLAHHTMGGIHVVAAAAPANDDEQQEHEEARRTTSLQKASKLYELSYTLIANTTNGGTTTRASATLLKNPMFIIAILNNMAVCNEQLERYEISNHLFERLLSLVMLYIVNGGVEYSDAIMQLFGNFLFDNLSPVIFGTTTTNSMKLCYMTANAA